MKSNIHQILTNHFLPAPVLFGKNDQGVFASSVQDQSAHFGSLLHRIALSSLVTFEFFGLAHAKIVVVTTALSDLWVNIDGFVCNLTFTKTTKIKLNVRLIQMIF